MVVVVVTVAELRTGQAVVRVAIARTEVAGLFVHSIFTVIGDVIFITFVCYGITKIVMKVR